MCDFCKAGQLYAMANAFENELGSMQFAENGLAPSHLMELNDIWKDVSSGLPAHSSSTVCRCGLHYTHTQIISPKRALANR